LANLVGRGILSPEKGHRCPVRAVEVIQNYILGWQVRVFEERDDNFFENHCSIDPNSSLWSPQISISSQQQVEGLYVLNLLNAVPSGMPSMF
jgi:hypothetical protein